MERRGVLIAFEGGDLIGKSTQYDLALKAMKRLYHDQLYSSPIREPGSSDIGEIARYLVLQHDNVGKMLGIIKRAKLFMERDPEAARQIFGQEGIRDLGLVCGMLDKGKIYTDFSYKSGVASRTESMLFQAARAQLWDEKLIPLLNQRKIVLVDRCGYSSDIYQGIVRGLGLEWIETMNNYSTQGFCPDLVILINIDPDKGVAWLNSNKRAERNRLDVETIEFHRKVYAAYNKLPSMLPDNVAETFRSIDFGGYLGFPEEESVQKIHEVIMGHIQTYIEQNKHRIV